MTTSDKSGPLAPRRPLTKAAGTGSRPGQTAPTPPNGTSSTAGVTDEATETDSGSASSTSSTSSPSSSQATPTTPKPTSPSAGGPSAVNGAASRPPSGSLAAADRAGSNGAAKVRESSSSSAAPPSLVTSAPPAEASAAAGRAPFAVAAPPSSAIDIETQPALPIPSGLAPIPPAPSSADVVEGADKRADRAAAKAQRKLESKKPRTVRRAKLRIVRVDPWSVTKTAFLLSIAFGIMCVVAVFLIFSIMSASGLWDSVNTTIQGVVDQRPSEAFDIKDYVGMSRVMGITMLVAAIDVVIITALATLGAFIYNMSASLLGGIEVTLAEDLH